MNVLIIPEDFRTDQHILKPLFEKLFRDIGKPQAKVRICRILCWAVGNMVAEGLPLGGLWYSDYFDAR